MVFDPEPRGGGGRWRGGRGWGGRRLTTETKQAFKTTEFWVFAAILTGLMVASWVIGEDWGGGGDDGDIFRADAAWRLAVVLTIGYLISRGLAKAGSREPYWEESGMNRETERTSVAERVGLGDGGETVGTGAGRGRGGQS